MAKIGRRRFLARSKQVGLGAAAGALLLGVPKPVKALDAHEKIVLGVVGIRGRGRSTRPTRNWPSTSSTAC